MKKQTALVLMIPVLSLFAAGAFAHEGHGEPSLWHSLLHHIVEPVHAIPVLVVAAILLMVLAGRGVRGHVRRRQR